MIPLYYKVFLNCLFYLLQFLGLFLPVDVDDLTLHQNRCWTLKQCYAVLVSIFLALGYAYVQWLNSQTFYKTIRTSSVILLVLSHTTFTIICLTCILGTVFWNKEKWSHYLKLQRILKSKMRVKLTRNKCYFCMEFILGHAALFVVIGVDVWQNLYVDKNRMIQIVSVFLKNILFYYVFLITIVIFNAVLLLRNYFQALRIFLTSALGLGENCNQFTLHKRPQQGAMLFPVALIGSKTMFELTEASKILNILVQCVDIFNQLFGLILMFINIATILIILLALNTLLVSGETNQLTMEIILYCLFVALVLLVWNSFILSASGLLKEETSEIVNVCCKLQHLLPQTLQERKELLNIAHQVKRKSPTISAAGFFNVDFYLILAVFTYVGTYIVVLIQFTHMDF